MQITSSLIVRVRCSFFRALSRDASLSRRLCGEDVALLEVPPLGAVFSSLLAFATWLLLPIRLKESRVYLGPLRVICQ
jgi:hypothetical protein